MLDISLLRKDLDAVLARLALRKNPQPYLDDARFRELEAERKRIQTRTEELQSQRNSLSKQIGMLKGKAAKGEDTAAEVSTLMAQVAAIADEMSSGAARLDTLQGEMADMLLTGQKATPDAALKLGFRFKYPRIGEALAALSL